MCGLPSVYSRQSNYQFHHRPYDHRAPYAIHLASSAIDKSEDNDKRHVPVRRLVRTISHVLRMGGTGVDTRRSVCMISIIRLTNLVTTDFSTYDIAWAFADFSMWYCVEANIAIVSGNAQTF